MNQFQAPDIQWAALTPVLILMGSAVVGVLVESFIRKPAVRRSVQVVLTLAAIGGALVAGVWRWFVVGQDGPQALVAGALREDPFAIGMQVVLLISAFIALLVVADRADGEDAFTPNVAAVPGTTYEEKGRRAGLIQTEVYPLLLFSLTGMWVFTSAADLLTLFVALEVLSLPLYLLTSMARRRRLLSQEAALKYFLLGAFASAFFLMGIALLYGYSGGVGFDTVAQAVPLMVENDWLLLAGVVLVLVGLLFKVGAVPFHQWTPDVYQGAPTPITGFMAAATKIAAFGALVRFLYVVTPDLTWDLTPFLWVISGVTIVVGTILAIVQTDIKRTLAYSSVAHAGFLLLGVITLTGSGPAAIIFYLLAYSLATIGAFALVAMVRTQNADGSISTEASHLSAWAGLGRRSPLLAVALTIFMLSFAGIPLTAGFIGKFAVFSAAIEGGAWPMVVLAVLASVAAAFFYVRVIVLMFFTEPATDSSTVVVKTEGLAPYAAGICVVGTLVLGVWPTPVLDLAAEAAKFLL